MNENFQILEQLRLNVLTCVSSPDLCIRVRIRDNYDDVVYLSFFNARTGHNMEVINECKSVDEEKEFDAFYFQPTQEEILKLRDFLTSHILNGHRKGYSFYVRGTGIDEYYALHLYCLDCGERHFITADEQSF